MLVGMVKKRQTSIEPAKVLAALSTLTLSDEGTKRDDLVAELWVKVAWVNRALKQLLTDGLVEQTSKRPPRYRASGGGD